MKLTQNFLNKIKYINKNSIYVVSFGIVYLIWNYTVFIRAGGVQGLFDAGLSTLDASWMIGLNWATQLHLKWAADNLVFTFGPLYYLDGYLLPEFHRYRTLLIVHLAMNLLFVACFSYVFSLFNNSYLGGKNRWPIIIVVAMLLTQKPNISLLPLFVAFVSLPIVFPKDETGAKSDLTIRYIRYGIVSSILALIPFTKFSHMYESILLIVILACFLSYNRRFFDAALICFLFIIFSILIWVLATGDAVSSYFSYLLTRFIISSGYTEAMMMSFSHSIYFQIFVLALLYLAALGLVLLYFMFTRQIDWMTAWLFPLTSLFLGFKNSFVRADGHAYIFLSYVFLSALYYYYLVEFNKPEKIASSWIRTTLTQTFVPFLAIIVFSSYSFLGGKLQIKNEFLDAQKLLKFSPDTKSHTSNLSREAIRKIYDLEPEFLGQIDTKKTTDVIPWDIALLYGNDLLWMPRPVIQSYASYTSELDALDAEFFRKSNSPEQLIVSLFTIDQRYILFDTPATFQVLLDSYRYVSQSSNGRFALFKKNSKPMFRDFVLIDQKEFSLSNEILIPTGQDGHVFMFVEVEPTVIGKLFDILYKPTTLFIEINLKNGEQRRHRFISDTGNNGLFVSKYVGNLNDLEMVFNEAYDQNITSIRFLGDGNIYKKTFKVHFYKIPFK